MRYTRLKMRVVDWFERPGPMLTIPVKAEGVLRKCRVENAFWKKTGFLRQVQTVKNFAVKVTVETVFIPGEGMNMSMVKALGAECIGSFWQIFGGCGSALLAAVFPELGVGYVGVAIAYGLTVTTMAFALSHISGCHLNPAITIGLAAGGNFPWKNVIPYVVMQIIGACCAAFVLYLIYTGRPGAEVGSFASNGYGEHSPGHYSLFACFLVESVLAAGFLFVVMGAHDSKMPTVLAPIASGLCLALIHLISIPVTNTSVNPARSTAQALFASVSWPLQQLWMFWAAPIVGGVIGALAYRWFVMSRPAQTGETQAGGKS